VIFFKIYLTFWHTFCYKVYDMKRFKVIDFENSYLAYIKDINYYPLLSFKEEQELARKCKQGDKEARDKLIKSNLKLVIKIALQYYRPPYNLMDLIQEGNIGLITAVDKFDYKKKLRFSTYSSWWIKHYITRSILKKEFHISLPLRKVEMLYRIERGIYTFFQKNNRLPDLHELEKEVGIKTEKLKEIITYLSPVSSLNSTYGPNNDMSLLDVVSSKKYQPEEMVFSKDLLEYELEILNSLVERDAQILKYRYGFINGESLTLKDLGKIFGISPEAVRQIELKALKKIKINYKDLREYLIN